MQSWKDVAWMILFAVSMAGVVCLLAAMAFVLGSV
jgi:hypothetical protein